MKRSPFPALFMGALMLVSIAGAAAAQAKTVTIPKGTKVEKLGPGDFKLTTPDGTVFELRSFKKSGKGQGEPAAAGIIGDCGIRDAKGKLVASGANGVLKGGVRAAVAAGSKALKDVPAEDYVKIDDEITWLPATIQFPGLRVFNRIALNKLSPQPDPPGKR